MNRFSISGRLNNQHPDCDTSLGGISTLRNTPSTANDYETFLDAYFRKQHIYFRFGDAWIKNKTAFKVCYTEENPFIQVTCLKKPSITQFKYELRGMSKEDIEGFLDNTKL